MIGTLIMPVFIGTVVTIVCCGFYMYGYHDAMKKAGDMLDSAFEKKFKDAGVVVKKDDRIIECNGIMIPMQCKKCMFGRVNEGNVECFVPDYDGVTTMGLKRMEEQEKKLPRCQECGYVDHSIMYASDPPQYKCEKYGCLVRITDTCKGENTEKPKEK